jgi:hypothetical protein
MRSRNVVVLYVLGTLAIIGGIVVYNDSNDKPGDDQVQSGPSKRAKAPEGILIDLAIPERVVEVEQADTTEPGRRATTPPATHASRSAAGGGAAAPAARPAMVMATPACSPSLLGSVLGLLGSLLGAGGGC